MNEVSLRVTEQVGDKSVTYDVTVRSQYGLTSTLTEAVEEMVRKLRDARAECMVVTVPSLPVRECNT